MNMQPTVVDVVMITLKATSPPAMRVHKLEDWPPLVHPRITMPTKTLSSNLKTLEIMNASMGMMP